MELRYVAHPTLMIKHSKIMKCDFSRDVEVAKFIITSQCTCHVKEQLHSTVESAIRGSILDDDRPIEYSVELIHNVFPFYFRINFYQ